LKPVHSESPSFPRLTKLTNRHGLHQCDAPSVPPFRGSNLARESEFLEASPGHRAQLPSGNDAVALWELDHPARLLSTSVPNYGDVFQPSCQRTGVQLPASPIRVGQADSLPSRRPPACATLAENTLPYLRNIVLRHVPQGPNLRAIAAQSTSSSGSYGFLAGVSQIDSNGANGVAILGLMNFDGTHSEASARLRVGCIL